MISRCGSNAKVRHDMWVKIRTNFGDDVYAWTVSLLDSSDTVSGVQHLENKDLLYMIVAVSGDFIGCSVEYTEKRYEENAYLLEAGVLMRWVCFRYCSRRI